MDQLPGWANAVIAIGGAIGTLVTAVATFFLWRVTKTLARETTRMAEASAQPHVVATLAPNRWSMIHFDLHVDNTGNATAYDVILAFEPPLIGGEGRGHASEVPFQKISVLKPGQGLSSYLSEYRLLDGKSFRVSISWKRDAARAERQHNEYTLSIADHDGTVRLGDEPLLEIAKHIGKLEASLSPVARGSRRAEVDVFMSLDRLRERRNLERKRREWKRRQEEKKDSGI
ncbi:hypothetical protein QTH91_04665 [Variovorax dokdonensis]|uniref:Uncharacterized protein n=1 Tax=Variovorax dokdonensis TaxID=344883 RepID=A0ABT7N755_9BURK|nr:hypothetical protein [Variovorax dokdonensis]MDM0043767.1 hypothetical protein [Variovorax dokdonensis]